MLTSPFVIPGLLLAGALITYLIIVLQPRFANYSPPAVSGLVLLLWFIMGRRPPQTFSYGNGGQSEWLAGWRWVFDETIWPLVGILLFFILALTIFRLGRSLSSAAAEGNSRHLHRAQWQPVILLLLSAAGVMVLGAASTMTFIMSWSLFALLWTLFLLSAVTESIALPTMVPRLFWILVPLFFAGIAVAAQPLGVDLLDFSNWPGIAIVAVLLTVMAQMGVLPFIGWRPRKEPMAIDGGAVLQLMPALAGAGLLSRLLATGHYDATIVLLLTLMALLSIVQGLRRIWMYGQTSASLPADLALVLTSLAFLVGIWTGTEAFIAAVRLFVFASTIFFFLEYLPLSRTRWWRAIAPLFALIAMVGFPLTVGFLALTAIYDVWLVNNRFLFILVLVALWLPLLTALLVKIRRSMSLSPETADDGKDILPMEAGQIVSALGLIMTFGPNVGEIQMFIWLILFVVGVGAYLLSRYMGEAQTIVATVNTAFKPGQQQLGRAWQAAGRFGEQVALILGESAQILEGEQGLLWLAAFLAILLLASVI